MSEHGQGTPHSEDPRPHSPVSVISRFSYEEHRDSNSGESPHHGRDSRASQESSISASSQPSTNHIGLVRPLSAALISSNSRFTSSVTQDLTRTNGLDSTEKILGVKTPIASADPGQGDGREPDEGKGRSMWNPFWLWRTTLMGFMLVFLLLLILLIILHHFSNLHRGLSTQISSNHYSWNYGPTAVFTILLCLWRQVDYHCKVLLPWKEMQERSAAPEKSLLLDYISISPMSGLLAAWNNRHWAVIATSLSSWLLILLTIFSTGLLVLNPSSRTSHSTALVATAQFNPFNGPSTQNLPATPWYIYYGILENGLGYPNGTSNNAAFQSLEPKFGIPENSIVTATVSAFFPRLDCEIADIHHSLTTSVSANAPGPAIDIVLNSTSCTATNSKSLCDPQTQNCPSQAFIYDMYTLNGIFSNNDCQIPPNDAYIFFAIGDVRYQQNASFGSLPSQEVSIANISGLICKPSYAISQARLVLNPSLTGTLASATVSKVDGSSSTMQSEFTNSNLTSFWYESFSAIGSLFDNDTDVDEALFHFMADANNHSHIEALLDPSVQAAAASTVFTAVMAQFAREYLLAPANITLEGQVAYNEDRLYVRGLSVWLIVVGLVLLICATIVILLYGPHDVVPRNPDSFAAFSTILTSSDSIKTCLQGTGHLSNEALQKCLATSAFKTSISSAKESFMIERQDASNWPLPPSRLSKLQQSSVRPSSPSAKHSSGQSNPLPPNDSETRYWRPFTVGLPFILVTLTLPIVTIVLLEIIQQYSNKHNGLVDIGDDIASANALSNYIPAAFMTVVSIMFNSFDFTLMIFAPFSTLAKGDSPARRGMMSNILGKIPVLGFLKAVVARHWAVCFSTTAAVVGSFLTIVVSGLYILNAVPGSSHVLIHQSDQFNFNWTNSLNNDSNAGTTISLIDKFNLSYPKFTYDELAFPTIRLSDQTEVLQNVLQVQLPATRATLNCTVIPSQDIILSTSSSGSDGEANVTAETQLPANCRFGGPAGNDSRITFTNVFQISSLDTTLEESYGGIMLDLHVAPSFDDSLGFQSYGESVGSSEADNPPGCPSLGFIFGSFAINNDDIKVNATALMCSQLAQEIQTDTHFLLPSFDLDPSRPPIPDEKTVKYLANQTNALPYRIQTAFATELIASNGTKADDNPTLLDPFFQTLLLTYSNQDPTSLVGPANTDRLITAINHLYRRYMAQVFNSHMRQTLTSSQNQTTTTQLPATLIHSHPNNNNKNNNNNNEKIRLVQDQASKLALQVLLGVMVVCGIAAYVLKDTKRVLMRAPTSIVGLVGVVDGRGGEVE